MFNKVDNFCDFRFGISAHQDTSEKGSTLVLEQTPFQKWGRISFDSPPLNCVHLPLREWIYLKERTCLKLLSPVVKEIHYS